MTHRHTDLESHGTAGLIRYFIHDQPGMSNGRVTRSYGRAMMRRIANRCVQCHFADLDRSRLRRIHAAYHRRSK
jgi:hypothetical protein